MAWHHQHFRVSALVWQLTCKSLEAAHVRTTYHGSSAQSEGSRSPTAYVLPRNLICCCSFEVAFWCRLRQCEIIWAVLHFTLPRQSAGFTQILKRFYREFTWILLKFYSDFTQNLLTIYQRKTRYQFLTAGKTRGQRACIRERSRRRGRAVSGELFIVTCIVFYETN